MAEQVYGATETKTVDITSNLSSKENYFVNFSASVDNLVAIAADATKVPYILLDAANGATTPAVGCIAVGGYAKVKLGGTVTPVSFLTSDGNGKAIACTIEGQVYGAVAQEGGVDGDIITVKVQSGTWAN